MNEIFIIAGDYLKGKSVYPAFRRILNLLLNISIASFIYEKFYGNYTWLNLDDYKSILDFFIKGNFFIPLSIFLVVYSVTLFLSLAIFTSINHFKSVKITRKILLYQFKNESIDQGLNEITQASNYVSPTPLTTDIMISAYQKIREKITPEAFKKIENELEKSKQSLLANYTLAFRMLIAITIYFFSLPQFGWILYTIAIILLVVGLYSLMFAYRFLDILPTILRRFHFLAEEYLKSHMEQQAAADKNDTE